MSTSNPSAAAFSSCRTWIGVVVAVVDVAVASADDSDFFAATTDAYVAALVLTALSEDPATDADDPSRTPLLLPSQSSCDSTLSLKAETRSGGS